MTVLAFDVGGANLKVADGLGFSATVPFPLWRTPEQLSAALAELLRNAPPADRYVATMTGELADCYETKSHGVAAIIAALSAATAGRDLRIYLIDGSLAPVDAAIAQPLLAAASNWHALASFALRYMPSGNGLLIDVGSTTCDVIPLAEGQIAATGRTDPERLVSGELVYTGVVRSPVCAVTPVIPWRGQLCPTAHEVFATTRDAYLLLGELPEDAAATDTADGRPATRAAARDRLARTICADRDMFSEDDALAAATAIRDSQVAQLTTALRKVASAATFKPPTIVLSGQGEFLARLVLATGDHGATVVSLTEQLGPTLSQCAPAHALAVLTRESEATADAASTP